MKIKYIIESIKNRLFTKNKRLSEATNSYQSYDLPVDNIGLLEMSENDFLQRIKVPQDDVNSNIKTIDIDNIDLNNSYFHFTSKDNLNKINNEGLKAQIGDASKMKREKKPRVYMSKGGKGVLEIKNSFIYEFKRLRICDIPIEYRKYFNIQDYSKEEQVDETDVYDAMEKRFKDEIYLKVDAIEGEDFFIEDHFVLLKEVTEHFRKMFIESPQRDVKGKENHNIEVEKLFLIKTSKGDTALDVIHYLYNRLLENAKSNGKEGAVRLANSDLDSFFMYLEQKEKSLVER